MKTIEELDEIKRQTLEKFNMDDSRAEGIRIVVGLATCGIAAGGLPIIQAFRDEIEKRGITDVVIEPTGCIGMCKYEPMAEVYMPGQGRTTYVNLSPDKVAQIVTEHLINHHPCIRYTIGAPENV